MRDKRYQNTAMGRDVVDFLAWMELGGAAPATLDQYERALSLACMMWPSMTLAEFVDARMLHVAKQFTPASRRVRVAVYRSFFKWALRNRLITLNPCDALPVIKKTPKRVFDLFTGPEITALCNLPIRDGALMQLMFDTGARNGDCRRLQLNHWRPEATPDGPYGMIVFRNGKGGLDRQAPATELLAMKLTELAVLDGVNPPDYLWWTRPGGGDVISRERPMGVASFNRWWRSCLEQAGVRYRHPHMTRHTMATRYLRNGGRLETLQIVLGHASIQTTSDLYGHLDMRDVALDMGLVAARNVPE